MLEGFIIPGALAIGITFVLLFGLLFISLIGGIVYLYWSFSGMRDEVKSEEENYEVEEMNALK